jgi:thiamine-phosphate pyrophosphorylase
MIMGISVSSLEEALRAQEEGADYLGAGPVYPTPSKEDAVSPIGIEGLRAITRAVRVPVVAIGGINEGNVEEVMKAGASGIAVISAVAAAADMRRAIRGLREAVDRSLAGR